MIDATKPDLIITCVTGLKWEHLRPFANSIVKSGFVGETVILVNNVDPFTQDCLRTRGFTVVPFAAHAPVNFVTHGRFVPLLKFLQKYGQEYRYVIWVDATDLIFQSDPTEWLNGLQEGPKLIGARECWRIKDEMQFNDPWLLNTFPAEYEWLRNQEVVCGGTVAGDAETMISTVQWILRMVEANPKANDQSTLAYAAHKPFFFPSPTRVLIPPMAAGWCATCSAFDTEGFHSPIGIPNGDLTDGPPVFDQKREIVLTPDGRKSFALVHQWNRDEGWIRIMHTKYGDLR